MFLKLNDDCIINMEPGLIYQSNINKQLYTSIKPYHILRYIPKEDKWIIIDYDEMINIFTNHSYHQYKPGQSNKYVKSNYEETKHISLFGVGYSYIKLKENYLHYQKAINLIDVNQLENLSFYKEKFSRPFDNISEFKEYNNQYIFNKTHRDDDIYY